MRKYVPALPPMSARTMRATANIRFSYSGRPTITNEHSRRHPGHGNGSSRRMSGTTSTRPHSAHLPRAGLLGSLTRTYSERSVNRDVLIYMNHPLRYRGETFYQAGFQKDDSATILQVVHNPSFIAPYVACVIVAAGLLVQFGFHLVGFSRQRRRAIT